MSDATGTTTTEEEAKQQLFADIRDYASDYFAATRVSTWDKVSEQAQKVNQSVDTLIAAVRAADRAGTGAEYRELYDLAAHCVREVSFDHLVDGWTMMTKLRQWLDAHPLDGERGATRSGHSQLRKMQSDVFRT